MEEHRAGPRAAAAEHHLPGLQQTLLAKPAARAAPAWCSRGRRRAGAKLLREGFRGEPNKSTNGIGGGDFEGGREVGWKGNASKRHLGVECSVWLLLFGGKYHLLNGVFSQWPSHVKDFLINPHIMFLLSYQNWVPNGGFPFGVP